MRKLFALTIVALFAATTFTPALAQQQAQEERASTLRVRIETVDLDAHTMAVSVADAADPITFEVNEETRIQGPEGELTLADLARHQGDEVDVRYLLQEGSVVALQVSLVA